jgi:hypothetical protein
METSEKEKAQFTKVASVFGSLEEEIDSPGLLSLETLKKVYLLFLLFAMVVTCQNSMSFFQHQVCPGWNWRNTLYWWNFLFS